MSPTTPRVACPSGHVKPKPKPTKCTKIQFQHKRRRFLIFRIFGVLIPVLVVVVVVVVGGGGDVVVVVVDALTLMIR